MSFCVMGISNLLNFYLAIPFSGALVLVDSKDKCTVYFGEVNDTMQVAILDVLGSQKGTYLLNP